MRDTLRRKMVVASLQHDIAHARLALQDQAFLVGAMVVRGKLCPSRCNPLKPKRHGRVQDGCLF